MKRCWLRLLKFLACLAAVIGFDARAAAVAENLRYLFLIDHSPEMATRQIATVETIYYLVRTGFENQIQPGEKFALWFYGSRLQTNAPMTWQPERRTELARNAANLFTGRIYSRLRPREKTLADAAPFIAASPRITVFIFSDSSQPLSGTPYDTAVNDAIQKHRIAFLRDDKPFIITLTAKNGEWIGGYIHTDLSQRFSNPETDLPTELLDKALVAVRSTPLIKTNDPAEIDKARDVLRDALAGKTKPPESAPIPASVMQFSPTLKDVPKETSQSPQIAKEEPKKEEPKKEEQEKPEPPKVVAATPAPVVATETRKPDEQKVEAPKKTEPVEKPVQVAAAPPIQKVPEPVVIAKPPEPPPAVKEEPKRVVREEPKPVLKEEPKPSLPPPAREQKSIEPPKPVQTSVESKSVSKQPESQAPAVTAIVTPPSKHFPWPILAGGIFIIAAIGSLAVWKAHKRAKSPGSIITQALPRPGEPLHRK